MKNKELIKKLKTMSPDAEIRVIRTRQVPISDMTWGTEEIECDLEAVVDLETRIHLEIEE